MVTLLSVSKRNIAEPPPPPAVLAVLLSGGGPMLLTPQLVSARQG